MIRLLALTTVYKGKHLSPSSIDKYVLLELMRSTKFQRFLVLGEPSLLESYLPAPPVTP